MENIITSTVMMIDGYTVKMSFTAENDSALLEDVKENILQTTGIGVDSGDIWSYNGGTHLDNRITSITPSSNHSLEETEKGMVDDEG